MNGLISDMNLGCDCREEEGIHSLPVCFRFKVFADYEDYIQCQDKVSALYKVSSRTRAAAGLCSLKFKVLLCLQTRSVFSALTHQRFPNSFLLTSNVLMLRTEKNV